MADHMTLADVYEAIDAIARHKGHTSKPLASIRDQADAMRLAARKIHQESLKQCNGVIQADGYLGWSESNQEKSDRAIDRASERFAGAFACIFPSCNKAFAIEVNRDPRGAPITINGIDPAKDRIASFW